MSKFLEQENEKAAEALAEMLEPAGEIFSDKDFMGDLQNGNTLSAAKIALKNHSKALIDILSIYDGIPRAEYKLNPMQIMSKSIQILKDKDLMSAFTLQEQKTES